MLSQRATHFADAPAFLNAAGKAFADPYDAHTNPNGYINLGVAENVLPQQLLVEKFSQIRAKVAVDPVDFRYGDFCGSLPLRKALAKLFSSKIFHTPVDPNHFRVTNGAGSCIEMLSACICDEDECIMMPTPIYHGLENDLNRRFKSILLPFPMKLVPLEGLEYRFDLDFDALNTVYEQSIKQGKIIRGLLNINPSNPFGTIFEEDQITQLMDWCLERNLHFISDEIYALSIFPSSNTPFVSAIQILEKKNWKQKELIHIVYSFSKDFALNGVRAGVLYSQNEQLLTAFSVCGYFTGVSFDTQTLLASMLQDDTFVDHFLKVNCELLEEVAVKSETLLKQHQVPFVKAQSGMFIFMNLLALSPKQNKTEDDEKRLWLQLLDDKKVYVTPGFVFKSPIPGWYRFCISCTPFEIIEMALKKCVEAATEFQ